MNDKPTSAGGSPAQLVDAYMAAWNSRDGAAVVDSLAPAGTYIDPMLPGAVSGEALAGYVQTLAAAMPDYSFTWETFEGAERVMLQWTMRGTWTGPMPGLPEPTGASFALRGLDIIEVGPEGISAIEGYFDTAGLLRQLGIEMIMAAGKPSA